MAVKLFADAYEHDPQPETKMRNEPLMDEDGDKAIGTRKIWTITGVLLAADTAALKVKVTALETAYAAPAVVALKNGGTTLHELTATAARAGALLVAPPSYPKGNNAEYANKREYSITVKSDEYDGNQGGDADILFFEQTTTFSYNQHGKATRTITGLLRTQDGVSAEGKFVGITPAVLADANRMSYSQQTNDDDDELTWSFVDTEYWIVWPANVTGGQSVRRNSLGANGLVRVNLSGNFIGDGAQARATVEKLSEPRYRTVSEEQTVNFYDGSVSFNYEYIDRTDSETDYIAYNETIVVDYGSQDFVVLPTLGGGVAIRQETVVRPSTARQSGSAIGHSSFPSFPALAYDTADLKPPKSQTKSGPDLVPDGKYTNYRIAWSYNFLFAAVDPGHPDPSVAS